MAKSKIRVTFVTDDDATLEWLRPDGTVEFVFETVSIDPTKRGAAFVYGVKQILADGGAVGRDVPETERLAKMEKRAAGLINGTWAFRDGHGAGTTIASDSSAMYAALCAVGILPKTAETLFTWRSLKPAERRAVLEHAGHAAKAKYEEICGATSRAIDGASILDRIRALA